MDCGDEAEQVEESLLESHDDVEGSVATGRQTCRKEKVGCGFWGLRGGVVGVLAWVEWVFVLVDATMYGGLRVSEAVRM